mgnify:CR=1 FL=1
MRSLCALEQTSQQYSLSAAAGFPHHRHRCAVVPLQAVEWGVLDFICFLLHSLRANRHPHVYCHISQYRQHENE